MPIYKSFCERQGRDPYKIGKHRYRLEKHIRGSETTTVASHQIFPMPIIRPRVSMAQRKNGKMVAVKCSRRSNYGGRLLLERERAALMKLRHSNVAAAPIQNQLLISDPEDGHFYLVTEWLGDRDEQTWKDLSHFDLPEEQEDRLYFVAAMVDAVHRLHQRKVYHGDLKPSHFLVSKDWHQVRVIDFGAARTSFDDDLDINLAGGTPGFSLPEPTADYQRRDVFGLCATLFFVFTGYAYPLDPKVCDVIRDKENELAEYEREVLTRAQEMLTYNGPFRNEPELARMILDGLRMGWEGSTPVRTLAGLQIGDVPVLKYFRRGRYPCSDGFRAAVGSGIASLLAFLPVSLPQAISWPNALKGLLAASGIGVLLWLSDKLKAEEWSKVIGRLVMFALTGIALLFLALNFGRIAGELLPIFVVSTLLSFGFFIIGTKRTWEAFLGCLLGFVSPLGLNPALLPATALSQGYLLTGAGRFFMPIVSILTFKFAEIRLGVYGSSVLMGQSPLIGLEVVAMLLLSIVGFWLKHPPKGLEQRAWSWLAFGIFSILAGIVIAYIYQTFSIGIVTAILALVVGLVLQITQDFQLNRS